MTLRNTHISHYSAIEGNCSDTNNIHIVADTVTAAKRIAYAIGCVVSGSNLVTDSDEIAGRFIINELFVNRAYWN
jgi:hypothetical protein